MKKIMATFLATVFIISLVGCFNNRQQTTMNSESNANTPESSSRLDESDSKNITREDNMTPITIKIGNKSLSAMLYDNESARTILKQMPFTLNMDDYGAQEKVAELTFDIPSEQTITLATINEGDIYLWSGSSLVLFYTTFSNSYSYVPIGYITDISELKEILENGTVVVTFEVQ